MAPTRPNAAEAADRRIDRARVSGGEGRLATVTVDFLLDPELRLTEQERSLMTAMLLGLVGTLADEIRVRLPQELAAATEIPPRQLVAALRDARLLDRAGLVPLLLRRAEEIRVREALSSPDSPVQSWTNDPAPAIAAAAMSVVLARAAATDRFGRPGLEIGDCDAETAVTLSYAVAAVLAAHARGQEDAVVAAAIDLLGRHDEGQRLHALEARLVLALEDAARLDGSLLARLAACGELNLLAEGCARLAGIRADSAWHLLAPPRARSLALLLRMAGQPREVAASVIAALIIPFAALDPAAEIGAFDTLAPDSVERERTLLRHPPEFAAALAALSRDG